MDMLQNLRYAVRTLLRSPGFAGVAILTLALGIGANTAIFSVVNSVLLRPLPYAEPERLVNVFHFYPSLNNLEAGAAAPSYRDLKERARSFQAVAVQSFWGVNYTGGEQPERLVGQRVSGEFFGVMGVPAALGRGIGPEDVAEGRGNVVVLSHGLWQRAFGGDPGVVGRTLQLNGEAHQVVGVMPPSFRDFVNRGVELWSPAVFTPAQLSDEARTNEFLTLTARLKPGVSAEDAAREMDAFAGRLRADFSGAYPTDWTLRVRSLPEQATGKIRPALMVLLGAVGFVLLIACGNVANLLLSRAAARRKEVAIRGALGARGRDLVAQLLTESLLLSGVGGALGLALAYAGLRALVAANPARLPWMEDVSVDGAVLLFTLGVTVATGVVFGLLPALQATRTDLQSTLREGGRSGVGDGGRTVRRVLVVAQVALALVLLSGAGLLIRSFAELQRVSPGFDPGNVLTANVSLPTARYPSDTARVAFWDAALERVAALPGVRGVGAINTLPFGGGGSTASFTVEGHVPGDNQPGPWGDYRIVTPGYHQALRIPLLRGRLLGPADRMGAPAVAVVDQELARRYWPGQDPVGKRISYDEDDAGNPEWITVVGVVGHAAQEGLDAEPRVQVYLPQAQQGAGGLALVVRTAGDPAAMAGPLRAAIRAVDPDQPISGVRTMEELMGEAVGQRRFSMMLLGLFAGIALLLASVGIYGVISFDVARRQHEMGVRMALGAERGRVLGLVLGQGMRLALVGIGIGLLGSLALSRLIASQLYGVAPTDPLTLGTVVLVLAAIAALATLVPARRATRVDPLVALRAE